MSLPQHFDTHASTVTTLYGFVLTDEGPILYFDLLAWKQALEEERAAPFCDMPFGKMTRDGLRRFEQVAA